MNARHFLLATLIHLALAAAAQQGTSRSVVKNVDVRKDETGTTITISTTENGETTTSVLTGTDAEAYLAGEGASTRTISCREPMACKVLVVDDKGTTSATACVSGSRSTGDPKAEVYRYHYKAPARGTKDRTVTREVRIVVTEAEDLPAEQETVGNDATTVADPVIEDGLVLFPNPSDGHFAVIFDPPGDGGTTITVVDATGRELLSERTTALGPQTRTFDLHEARKGTYIATMRQGDVTVSKMLVVK